MVVKTPAPKFQMEYVSPVVSVISLQSSSVLMVSNEQTNEIILF